MIPGGRCSYFRLVFDISLHWTVDRSIYSAGDIFERCHKNFAPGLWWELSMERGECDLGISDDLSLAVERTPNNRVNFGVGRVD